MALAVLIFHYDKWLKGIWDASTLQGRLGIYAVSIFFVLSGLTLTLVYENRLDGSFKSWAVFLRKRFWRIFPLLWLATAVTLLLDDYTRPVKTIFLNFTGLFGFFNPADDIATGAWSIGCELVFYAAFPILFLLAQRNKSAFFGIFTLLFAVGIWVAFNWFSTFKTDQAEWWEAYVQVANQAFFFVGGMAIGVFRHVLTRLPHLFWQSLLVISGLCFAFWPIETEAFHLVSGWNRLIFSSIALMGAAAFYNSQISLTGLSHQLFSWLGAVSYSVYLLHPLVFRATHVVRNLFRNNDNIASGNPDVYWPVFIAALCGTLILSHFSYNFLEKPLAKKG